MLRHNVHTDAQICGKSASQASLFVRHGRGVNRVYQPGIIIMTLQLFKLHKHGTNHTTLVQK